MKFNYLNQIIDEVKLNLSHSYYLQLQWFYFIFLAFCRHDCLFLSFLLSFVGEWQNILNCLRFLYSNAFFFIHHQKIDVCSVSSVIFLAALVIICIAFLLIRENHYPLLLQYFVWEHPSQFLLQWQIQQHRFNYCFYIFFVEGWF